MFDTIVEVTLENGDRGNVIMKSYYPSNNKKKGATTELRKHSEYEYDQVEVLLSMITILLDKLIAGGTLEGNSAKDPIFKCLTCNFESKSIGGLKTHRTKIHGNTGNKCKLCDFVSDTDVELDKHMGCFHGKEKVKKRKNSLSKQVESPITSPLRKKPCNPEEGKEDVEMEIIDIIDDIITNVQNNDVENVQSMLNQRIEYLESELEKEREVNKRLKDEINQLKYNALNAGKDSNKLDLPKHLKKVHDRHLSQLKGFSMRYCATPDGACLVHCMTAHISCSQDQSEREINRRRINNHITDYFEPYYSSKISLPYTETVGVGRKCKKVVCNTNEEFLNFLRSEDAIFAFSNCQELIAIANMLNINIKVFSYGVSGDADRCEWTEINPDPEMSSAALFPKGLIPDMFLYNSDQSHFDLLVSEEHQLFSLGMTDGQTITNIEFVRETVKPENDTLSQVSLTEKLLDEQLEQDYDTVDLEELDDEVVHFQAAQKNIAIETSSDGSSFKCTICDGNFKTKSLLHEHTLNNHEKREFECYSCSFQASSSAELMKHLRLTGHQPSKALQDLRSKIIVCYTCKEEYTSYWSLMNHRRQKHPSNKVCRYYLRDQCIHGVNCWYRHDEPMQVDQSSGSDKECEKVSKTKPIIKSHITKSHEEQSKPNVASNQDFQKVPLQTFPPDALKSIMETLQMVLQRMDLLETKQQN